MKMNIFYWDKCGFIVTSPVRSQIKRLLSPEIDVSQIRLRQKIATLQNSTQLCRTENIVSVGL